MIGLPDVAIRLLVLLPFVLAAVVDLPRVVRVGSITALGGLTVLQIVVAGVGLLFVSGLPRSVVLRFLPYAAYLFWMVLRSAVELPDVQQAGLQNAFAYTLFAAELVIAGALAFHQPQATRAAIVRGFDVLDVVALSLVLISFVVFGVGSPAWLVGPRAVALLGIVPVCWHLSGWAYGRPYAGTRALVWMAAIAISLSRTAFGVAVLTAGVAFLAGMWARPTRMVGRLPMLAGAVVILIGLLLPFSATFYNRFFNEFNQVAIGGVAIDAAGRNHIWPVVIESAMKRPYVGQGLGSSQVALQEFDPETVGHPHNEYLRVWHDGGVIGLVLLLAAFVSWLVGLSRQWLATGRQPSLHPEVDLAALLTLGGIMLAAITDNPLVYTYVMSLGGLMIGAAMGFAAARRRMQAPAGRRISTAA